MSEMADDNETIVIDNNTTSTSLSGFGDVIKLFTSLFGLDTCDKCEERRVRFNRKFAFVRKGKLINDEDILFLQSVCNMISKEQQERIIAIYNYVYSDNQEVCYCAGLFKSVLDKLNIQIDKQMRGRK